MVGIIGYGLHTNPIFVHIWWWFIYQEKGRFLCVINSLCNYKIGMAINPYSQMALYIVQWWCLQVVVTVRTSSLWYWIEESDGKVHPTYIKEDRTECFDGNFPCRKHVVTGSMSGIGWKKLFIILYLRAGMNRMRFVTFLTVRED
jgi:hypothetical protein